MSGQRLVRLAFLAAVWEVVCGGVVGGEWRQGTGLACDETLNLDFSGPEPQVECSSPCEDSVKTWSAGPLFRREARLTEQGYMVRQEYRQDGTITCSLVSDVPEVQDLQSALQSEACTSVSGGPDVTTVPGSSEVSTVSGGPDVTTVPGSSEVSTVSGGPDVTTVPSSSEVSTVSGGPDVTTVPNSSEVTTVSGGPDVTTVPGSSEVTTVHGSSPGMTESTITSNPLSTIVVTGSTQPNGGKEDTSETESSTFETSTIQDCAENKDTTESLTQSDIDILKASTIAPTTILPTTLPPTTLPPTTLPPTTLPPTTLPPTTLPPTTLPPTTLPPTTLPPTTLPPTTLPPTTLPPTTLPPTTLPPTTLRPTTLPPTTTTTTTTTTPRPTTVSYGCPSGWKLFDQSCYYVSTNTGSWEDGRSLCRSKGGSYVKITGVDEFNFVKSLVTANTWIGLNDRDTEGRYIWDSDGSAVSYKNWGSGEPNDDSLFNVAVEDCVELHENKGFLWNDESCGSSRRFACERAAYVYTG